jgi:hypothetical protein
MKTVAFICVLLVPALCNSTAKALMVQSKFDEAKLGTVNLFAFLFLSI